MLRPLPQKPGDNLFLKTAGYTFFKFKSRLSKRKSQGFDVNPSMVPCLSTFDVLGVHCLIFPPAGSPVSNTPRVDRMFYKIKYPGGTSDGSLAL